MFDIYLDKILESPNHARLKSILEKVSEDFSELSFKIAWGQPMFVYKKTFIIGFSASKGHIAVAPEKPALKKFENRIKENNYILMKEIFKISLSDDIDYDLISDIIKFNIDDKKDCKTFWRNDI